MTLTKCDMSGFIKYFVLSAVLCVQSLNSRSARAQNISVKTSTEVDVCVYGATAAGIAAALAVAREGQSVVIVEPTHKIGGLLSSGFRMAQDVPYADHLGGITGEFYKTDIQFPKLRHVQGASKYSVPALQKMINQYGDLIQVITDHRIHDLSKSKGSIKSAVFEYAPPDENGVPLPTRKTDAMVSVIAKVFIDASYEGDMMAMADVSYRIGKEGRNEYGETLAGVVISKEFPGVDPYKIKGDPSSGLLSCIHPDPIGKEGDASRFFMAYNFKLAWEANPTPEYPGVLITPPQYKNQDVYELLKRYKEAGYETSWPNENFSRGQLMTGTLPGLNTEYPDGDWKTRSRIWQAYIDQIKTLTDFSGKEVRLLSDNNEETNGWPSYLYIRSARRMVGEYVMTQKDLQLQTEVPTPIGLGYYMVDIYPNRMGVLPNGTLVTEGNVWEMVCPGPYQIPYGALIPKKKECTNLIVPLCMSASHIAYSSIRMESTYMVMGEAAGVAAALAISSKKAVQDIDRNELTTQLLKNKQLLKWDGKGYRVWRYNFLDNTPRNFTPRWTTHPEEYSKHSVESLWK
jgi:hypothetical protein